MRLNFLPPLRMPWLAALLPVLGCSELIGLGTECPEGTGTCPIATDGKVELPPTPGVGVVVPPLDASVKPGLDAGKREAGTLGPPLPGDAEPSAFVDLIIGNGGFEIKTGIAGDVTAVSLPTATGIAPWYTCQPIGFGDNPTTAVRAENSVTLASQDGLSSEIVTAPDGSKSFISIRYLVTLLDFPLLQQLTNPLVPGLRYAIAVEARSDTPSTVGLALQLRGANYRDLSCVSVGDTPKQSTLAESDPIMTPGWRTLCLPFTAPVEYTHLMLSVQGGALNDGRLFLDNIRNATPRDCPNL
jgi:hypothetical protein